MHQLGCTATSRQEQHRNYYSNTMRTDALISSPLSPKSTLPSTSSNKPHHIDRSSSPATHHMHPSSLSVGPLHPTHRSSQGVPMPAATAVQCWSAWRTRRRESDSRRIGRGRSTEKTFPAPGESVFSICQHAAMQRKGGTSPCLVLTATTVNAEHCAVSRRGKCDVRRRMQQDSFKITYRGVP